MSNSNVFRITLEMVLRQARDVIQIFGPSYFYPCNKAANMGLIPVNGVSCSNEVRKPHAGEKHLPEGVNALRCIVGEIFCRFGYSLGHLQDLTGVELTEGDVGEFFSKLRSVTEMLPAFREVEIDRDAYDFLAALQSYNDQALSWGQAFNDALQVIPESCPEGVSSYTWERLTRKYENCDPIPWKPESVEIVPGPGEYTSEGYSEI